MQPTLFQDKLTIGAWTFNDPLAVPAGVTQLGANILDGWDTTVPVDVLVSSRGMRDGDVPADHFPLRSRRLIFGGWMYCVSRTAARQAYTAMCRDAFPLDTDLTLTRYEPDAAKSLTVRRAGEIELPALTNMTGPHLRFVVPLQAFDPLKYASTVDINATAGVAGAASGGLVVPVVLPAVFVAGMGAGNVMTVVNTGSHETKPTTTITGPLPTGWHWDNSTTGESLALDVSLSAGDRLVLNHQIEAAYLNGFPLSPAITGDWWSLIPGGNTLRVFGDFDPAATVTITAKSAWE